MSIMIKAIYAKNKLRNYQYLLKAGQMVCIDPYDGEQVVGSLQEGEQIDILLNTHQHHDHIRGNQTILNQGAKLLEREEMVVQLNDKYSLKRLHTPGHTLDSDSLLLYENDVLKAIFGGDTLFVGGVGNCYNGGDASTLAQTLIQLDTILKHDTLIYPGHDYWESNSGFALENFRDDLNLVKAIEIKNRDPERGKTTWGAEKEHNPFLKALFEEDFRQKFFPDTSRVEAFCNMRKMRDNF